jgi:hypothetical protein
LQAGPFLSLGGLHFPPVTASMESALCSYCANGIKVMLHNLIALIK